MQFIHLFFKSKDEWNNKNAGLAVKCHSIHWYCVCLTKSCTYRPGDLNSCWTQDTWVVQPDYDLAEFLLYMPVVDTLCWRTYICERKTKKGNKINGQREREEEGQGWKKGGQNDKLTSLSQSLFSSIEECGKTVQCS